MYKLVFFHIFLIHFLPLAHVQANKLAQLRNLIKPKVVNGSFAHFFIQDDLYIQHWLKDSKFNVAQAEKRFLEHLAWRNKENIDNIHLEDWSYFKSEYPQFINSNGESIVAETWLSNWNIRRAILTGQRLKLLRWMTYLLELSQRRFYEMRQGGKVNLTKIVEIIDIEGFNLLQHGCTICAPIYIDLSQLWETHYPGIWNAVYMINMNPNFRIFLNMGKSMKYDRNDVLQRYTYRIEWLPIFDKEMSKDVRSLRFGGNIERSYID